MILDGTWNFPTNGITASFVLLSTLSPFETQEMVVFSSKRIPICCFKVFMFLTLPLASSSYTDDSTWYASCKSSNARHGHHLLVLMLLSPSVSSFNLPADDDDDAAVVVNDDVGSLTKHGPGVVNEGGKIVLLGAAAADDDEDRRLVDPNSKGPDALTNFRGVVTIDENNIDPLVVAVIASESTSWLLGGVGTITCCDAGAEAEA